MVLHKKQLRIAGTLLFLAILIFAGYQYWFSTTHIAVINALPAQSSNIILNNSNHRVKIEAFETNEISSFDSYDAILLYGRGLYLDEDQIHNLHKAENKGIPVFTMATSLSNMKFNYNITEKQHQTLIHYFNNGPRKNYRNGINFLAQLAAPQKLHNLSYEEPIILPQDLFYHLEEGKYFNHAYELTEHLKEHNLYNPNGKNIAFIAGINFPVEGSRAHVDTLISKLSKNGYNVYPISSYNLREKMLKELHPDALIYFPMGRLGNDDFIQWLHNENIPLFCPFPLVQSREDWLDPMIPVSGGTLNARILIPEIDGAMTPLLISTQDPDEKGFVVHQPVAERVTNFIEHLNKYFTLQTKKNKDKKLTIVYFKNPGKNALIASGMEVIPSLYNLLLRLKDEGYNLGDLPSSLHAFEERIMTDGKVIGSYAPGAQEEFLSTAQPLWISKSQYESWARSTLEPSKYQEVIDKYGDAPGQLLSRTSNTEPEIAIASIQYGNILLFPQPRPALGDDDFKLVHGMPVPPPHSYLAPYLYALKEFNTDALIHFGTHGNLEYTPGKNVALSKADWADVLIGSTPHFYLYTTANVGEAIIAKRRTHAVIITHLTPPFVESGMRQAYNTLLNEIHQLLSVPQEKNELALKVKKEVIKLGLHRDLGLDSIATQPYSYEELEQIDAFAEEIANAKITGAFYTLGEAYSARDLITTTIAVSADPLAYNWAKNDYKEGKISKEQLQNYTFISRNYLAKAKQQLFSILSQQKIDTLKLSEEVKEALRYQKQLTYSTENELNSLIRGLNGGTIYPAPGGDPVLNPNILPTGRNMFSINVETTPTPHSWEEGKRLAEETLKQYKRKHGDLPKKVSYTFWAGEFINSEGATIAQALYMLGVEPLRDKMGRIVDLRLIPSEELGRSRINIVIQVSGQLRDIAGSRLKLITDAIKLASSAQNDLFHNFVLSGTLLQEKLLIDQGIPPAKARVQSVQRVFGPLNSGYSTGMISYTDNSGSWNSKEEIAAGYLNNMGATYGDDEHWGEFQKNLLAAALSETDIVVQPRQSNTWGPLSLDHVYEFMGGASLAIKTVTGKEPDAFMADYRNKHNQRIQNLNEAVAVESRSTILNPVFIKERMKGEATTAQMFGKIFKNIYGWNVMRPSAVDKELFNDLYQTYIQDIHQLKIQKFFDTTNPVAYQEMTSVLIESARKGYWKATPEQLNCVIQTHAQFTEKHGAPCIEFICANTKLQDYITSHLPKPEGQAYQKQIDMVNKAQAGKSVVLKEEGSNQNKTKSTTTSNALEYAITAILVFIVLLYILKRRKKS